MDKTQFDEAVRLYQDTVYRTALHVTGSPQDAEDAVQEVFLRLYTRGDPFDGPEHLRRWLIRVTVNFCRDLLRSPFRRRRVSLSEVPDQPAFDTEEQGALYREVLALPEKYRTALYLFYYEELSVREIGALLNIRTSAVTTRLHRARAMLREHLTERGVEG